MASLISAGTERSLIEFAEKNVFQKALARPDLVKQFIEKAKREGWITTVEAARNRLEAEVALGYSNSGVVIEVGDRVTAFKVGDKVACAGGGFATHSEIVRIPQNLAATFPSGPGTCDVSFEQAAFATVGAIGLHGIRLAELQIGEVVAIVGLGLVGQIMVQLARANGCIVIGIDPNDARCRLAESMGCVATARSDEEMKAIAARVSSGRGVDSVLIGAATAGNEPVELAAEIARDRARIVAVGAVGFSLPRKPYYRKELDFRVSRSYGPGRYDPEYEEKGRDYPIGYVRWTEGRNLDAILQLVAAKKVDFAPLITHRIPIERAEQGYEIITGKTGEPFLGVLITYSNEPSLAQRVELQGISKTNTQPAERIRVGVIGAGNFAASVLLPAMKAAHGNELIGISSSGGASARSAGSRFGFRFCASDETELLNDPSIDAIVVCTRHSSHSTLVAQALEYGKHVFCEKPLALNEIQLATVANAFKSRHGHVLMVGYNRRFAPLARQLKAFVEPATEPFVMHYRVNAGFIPGDHWVHDREIGGGRILGEVCHFVDFLSFLCAQPVTAVSAAAMPNSGRYSDDNLSATLWFADGSLGTITYTANGDKSFSKERIEVFVHGRVAVLDDFKELRTVHDGRHRVARSRLRVDKGHRGEWQAFSNAIRTGGPQPIPFDELINGALATIALNRSSSNRSRVEVDTRQFLFEVSEGRWDSAADFGA